MDEYLAAISTSSTRPPPSNTHPSSPPPAGGGGSSTSLWTTDRIERIATAVRSLAFRGITASSKAEAADLIYCQMNDKDPRLSSAETLQFLDTYFSARLIHGFTYPLLKSQPRIFRLSKHHQQQGPAAACPEPSRRERFSPYSNTRTVRPPSFVWGLKTHRMFLDAVERLGGVEMAEPAAILRLMKDSDQEISSSTTGGGGGGGEVMNGLTMGEVGRHLVMFRYLLGLRGKGPVGTTLSSAQGGDSSMLDFFGDLKL